MQLNMNRQPTVGKDPRCQPAGLALRTLYIDAEAFMVISFRFCARKCAMPSFHKSKEGSPFSTPVYFRKLLNNAFIFPPLQTNMEPNGGPKVPLKNGWVFWAPESVGAQRIFRWPQPSAGRHLSAVVVRIRLFCRARPQPQVLTTSN